MTDTPPPPPGFVLMQGKKSVSGNAPPPPPGFVLMGVKPGASAATAGARPISSGYSGRGAVDDAQAAELAAFESANPQIAGKFNAANKPAAGMPVKGEYAGGGGRSGGAPYVAKGYDPTFEKTAPDLRAAKAAGWKPKFEPYVDWGAAPAGANENDRQVGLRDDGQPEYETRSGVRYVREMVYPPDWNGPGTAKRAEDLTFGGVAKGLASGVYGAVKAGLTAPGRALRGEVVTNDDVFAASGLITPGLRPVPVKGSVAKAARAPKTIAAIPETAIATDAAIGETLGLAAKAAKAPGGAAAQNLAAKAMPDKEAMAAAERLGFDLPADVYATNPLIRRAAGGARGIVGSEAEGHWISTISKAVDKADEVMATIAKSDISAISDSVLSQLQARQGALKSQAARLYSQVEKVVPRAVKTNPTRAIDLLETRAAELGGVQKLAPGERALLGALKKEPTYEWVKTQKGKIGQTAFGAPDQFPNFDKSFLRRLAGAMSEDLLATAEKVGGKEVRDALRLANFSAAQQKGIEKRILDAFGKDGFGSIATRLSSAIRMGAKGDVSGLNKILNILPEDAQADALASAIASLSKGKTAQGGFGFAEFAKLWGGVKSNSKIASTMKEKLGPAATAMLDDLARVSRVVTDARGNVSTTGKANQWLDMVPRGVIESIAQSNAAQKGIKRAFVGGGAMLGPVGAMAGDALSEAISFGGKKALEDAGALFRSPEFLSAMKKASDLTPEAIAQNPALKRWAATQKIGDLKEWISGLAVRSAPAAAQSVDQDPYKGLIERYGK